MNVYVLMGPLYDGYTIIDIFAEQEDAEAERARLDATYRSGGVHLEVQEWLVNNGKA